MLSRMRRIDCADRDRQLRICKDFGNVFLHRQTRIGEIEDMRNIRCQLPCGIGKPDRMKMRLDEVTVRELKRRRPHYAAYHRLGLAEIILVVRALRGAIGHDQGGLTGSPRAPGTLRVISRGRRHVAHVDGIERRDIDAQFHGRRAEQNGQKDVGLAHEAQLFFGFGEIVSILVTPAESPFAPLASGRINLRRVLAAFEPEQSFASARKRVGERAVEFREIWIGGSLIVVGLPPTTRRTAFAARRQPSTSKAVGTCLTS